MSNPIKAMLEEEVKADLTPMIDMVFQLILFFVVVNDFSSTQLEPVILARAVVADTDEKTDKESRTLVINVLSSGEVKINRTAYWAPGETDERLKDHIAVEAQLAGMVDNPASPGHKVSKLRVVIRADQYAKYEYVQKVFKACAVNGVFKTVINAAKEELNAIR